MIFSKILRNNEQSFFDEDGLFWIKRKKLRRLRKSGKPLLEKNASYAKIRK